MCMTEAEASELEQLVKGALEQRIEELRQLAVEQFRAGRDVGNEAAVAGFRQAALDLIASPRVGLYRRLLDRLPEVEVEAGDDGVVEGDDGGD